MTRLHVHTQDGWSFCSVRDRLCLGCPAQLLVPVSEQMQELKRLEARREQRLEATVAQRYFILKAQGQSENCPIISRNPREEGEATRLTFQEILGGAESSGVCLLGLEPLLYCLGY